MPYGLTCAICEWLTIMRTLVLYDRVHNVSKKNPNVEKKNLLLNRSVFTYKSKLLNA